MNPEGVEQAYEICDLIAKYEDVHDRVKKHFESFIKDTSVPLQDRWAIWLNAPDSLKNHSDKQHCFLNASLESHVGYLGEIFECEEYDTVKVKDVFREIQDKDEAWLESECIYANDILKEKELILNLNLGSFVYHGY